MWITKRQLKKEIDNLEAQLASQMALNEELIEEIDKLKQQYPFEIGQTVYDVQLRNDKGRYTKKNASREHSIVNEVVVDSKNYFKLVERYFARDVFASYRQAEKHLNEVCKD